MKTNGTVRFTSWNKIEAELQWVYDSVEPGFKFYRKSIIPHCSAWLLRRGSIQLTADDGSIYNIEAGQWFFPKNGERMHQVAPDTSLLSIAYYLHWPNQEPVFRDGLNIAIPAKEIPELEAASLILLDVKQQYFCEDFRLKANTEIYPPHHFELQARFYDWLNQLYRIFHQRGIEPSHVNEMDPRLVAAIDTIQNYPLTEKLNEVQIASAIGIGYKQWRRLFAKEFGMTPQQYFNHCRLKRAKSLLQMSNLMIKEIAYEIGFKTPAYFTTWFSKHTNLTPNEYRASSD